MASVISNESSGGSDVSSIRQSLRIIDEQASRTFSRTSWADYGILQTLIDTLYTTGEFRTASHSEAVASLTLQQSDVDVHPDGRALPTYERGQYKHQVFLAWWAICRGDQPVDVEIADQEKSKEREDLENYLSKLNNSRGDYALNPGELLAVLNGIMCALKYPAVPEPVFHVLATLQQHGDRFKSQAANDVSDLLSTISYLLERRNRARRSL